MMLVRRFPVVVSSLVLSFAAIACSAGYGSPLGETGGTSGVANGGASASGVDEARTIASSSPSERAQFCDWLAGESGGYGGTKSKCGGRGKLSAAPSQAVCVATFDRVPASCPA